MAALSSISTPPSIKAQLEASGTTVTLLSTDLISLLKRPVLPSSSPIHSAIMVGNIDLALRLQRALEVFTPTIRVATDPQCTDGVPVVFGRDPRVCRFTSMHLIPYSFKDREFSSIFQSLLPSYLSHLQKSKVNYEGNFGIEAYGAGFLETTTQATFEYAFNHRIPFCGMQCPLEGGNTFVFKDDEGKPKAIVGITGLILTVLALREQGYFERQTTRLKEIEHSLHVDLNFLPLDPSFEYVRMARNIEFYWSRKDLEAQLDEFEARKDLSIEEQESLRTDQEEYERRWSTREKIEAEILQPLSEQDFLDYSSEARAWAAKCVLAREVIAQDLGIPLANLAVLQQADFHIDMHVTVAPNGKVVYLDRAVYCPANIKILQLIGCHSVCMDGVIKPNSPANPSPFAINFMNGFFLPTSLLPGKHIYVTNSVAAENLELIRVFGKTLQKTCPSLVAIVGLPTQKILTEQEGGIRCMTWERPVYATPDLSPLDTIASYLGDATLPAETQALVYEAVPFSLALTRSQFISSILKTHQFIK